MTMRKGIVVAVHPEDYSVDLVMADDGSRLVGVQVMTTNGSTRSGAVDLPAIPERADKWDITQRTGQDMHAIVGYVGRNPVVTGFLYPQVNQMTHGDPKLRLERHQSDVTKTIDGDGNIQITHPSGTYFRVGEEPDSVDLTGRNTDTNLAVDRNTGRRVFIRIGMADNVLELTMHPTGQVDLKCDENINIKSQMNIRVQADQDIAFKAGGDINFEAGGSIRSLAGYIESNAGGILLQTPLVHCSNFLSTMNDVIVGPTGVSVLTHKHTGVIAGPNNTGDPVPEVPPPTLSWDWEGFVVMPE